MTQKIAAKALKESGLSSRAIARDLGVSHNSVKSWTKDERYEIIPRKEVDQIKNSLLGKTYLNAHRAQSAISQEKLDNSTALQLMTISAIGIDKARLMENLSTENIAHRGLIQSIENDRDKLMERMKDLLGSEG